MNKSEPSNLLTPKEAASFLKLQVQTLATWRTQGKGPRFSKLGRAVRYRPEDLQAYVASHLQGSPSSSSASPNVDERLGWSLAGFFVRQGPPGSTLVWGVRDYTVSELRRDDQGRLALVDHEGRTWRLLGRSDEVRQLLDL